MKKGLDYVRGTNLGHRVWNSYHDIIAACADA